MKQIFFLVLSLLFIISNETILDGPTKCPEGKTMRCFAAGPRRSVCFCYNNCPEGKKLVCSPFHIKITARRRCECKQMNETSIYDY